MVNNNWDPLKQELEDISDNKPFIADFIDLLKSKSLDLCVLNELDDLYRSNKLKNSHLYEELLNIGDPIDQCEIIRELLMRELKEKKWSN